MNIKVVGIAVCGLHETMAELALKVEHLNPIVATSDKIVYNGTGIELIKEQEREILAKALPIELKPIPIVHNFYREPRKSDDQPWAKCNRRRKY